MRKIQHEQEINEIKVHEKYTWLYFTKILEKSTCRAIGEEFLVGRPLQV